MIDIEANLEARQTLNEIRARGGYVLILYKPNGVDRYVEIKNGFTIPQFLRKKFRAQCEEIAKILKEEAAEE